MTHVERNHALAINDLTNIDTNPWDVGTFTQFRLQEGIGVKIIHLPWEERVICHHPDSVSIDLGCALLELQDYGISLCICNGPMEACFPGKAQVRDNDIFRLQGLLHLRHVREVTQKPSSKTK